MRVDSISAAVKVATGALREIAPPAHIALGEGDAPFWRSVIAEFPKADWTDHQLEVAAQLAKAMADLESEREALRREGYCIEVNDKMVANPRHGVARDLTNSVMSLRRNLQLHARAQGGELRDASKRRGHKLAIEAAVTRGDDDDFVARPN
jgi:hypothetical protein